VTISTRLSFIVIACLSLPVRAYAQVTTLPEAIHAAETANRTIQIATLEHEKAVRDVKAVKTQRFPVFSVIALGSQPLNQLGITLERGSLGVYPTDGPIPGQTTTLQSPLRFGFIGYVSVAQPLTQQYKIGLGIELAQVAVGATSEQLRTKRQGVINEADLLAVKAQLTQAEYELLKLDDPIQSQKEQLNRLMGRAIDAAIEIDFSSIIATDLVSLPEAYAEALASRPEIRLAKVQQRKSELERRRASAERIPDVSLSLFGLRTINYSSVFPSAVSSVGVQATWDVYDWGRKRMEVASKQDAETQAALELKDTEDRVRADVAHQYRRIVEARKELELAEALQASSTESLRVTRNRYAQREALLSEVVRIQSSLGEANHRYTQALMDLAAAQADFERAIGRDQ
jgi:outer membrane protein TolC